MKSGKVLDSSTIKNAIDRMHIYMINAKNFVGNYKNEVVVFQPKIQAVIMDKKEFQNSDTNTNETKKTAPENDIPVVLV